MREKLANLRGKLVAWKGWETGSRHNRTWICISKASISEWDAITPIQKSFNEHVIKVDHFWLTADKKNELHPQTINQYEKVCGLGVVKTYMRNDGTIDYTVRKPTSIYCVENFIEAFNDNFKGMSIKGRIKNLELAKKLLDEHTPENPTLYCIIFDFDKFKNSIYSELEFLKLSDKANDKALKTVKMNGKCKKLNQIKLPKKLITKTKGF